MALDELPSTLYNVSTCSTSKVVEFMHKWKYGRSKHEITKLVIE